MEDPRYYMCKIKLHAVVPGVLWGSVQVKVAAQVPCGLEVVNSGDGVFLTQSM